MHSTERRVEPGRRREAARRSAGAVCFPTDREVVEADAAAMPAHLDRRRSDES